jgi:hypothetical protein
MISPTIRIIRNGVDVISHTVETAYQRFRWLVISWRRPIHLGFILSRPRLAGLLSGSFRRSTRPPLTDDAAGALSGAAAGLQSAADLVI